MDTWLKSALAYVPEWLTMQMRHSQQPGCIVAVAHHGRVVLEHAIGSADLDTQEALTPRHRFRVASHSKSFTATGIMLLREQKKLRLDDEAGTYVPDLYPLVGRTTLTQLLSHSAGIVRDGPTPASSPLGARSWTATNCLRTCRCHPLSMPTRASSIPTTDSACWAW